MPTHSSPAKPVAPKELDVVGAIAANNALRNGRMLAIKYAAMAKSPFAFYRATAHLFYAHAKAMGLPAAPQAWISGDLHVENFGVFKGDNRIEYFDVNDFDEACFGPLSADIVRLGASIMLACDEIGLEADTGREMAQRAFEDYKTILRTGKAIWCEHGIASGAVKVLFEQIKKRKRVEFLDGRTQVKRRLRSIICDGQHYVALTRLDEKPANMPKIFAQLPPRPENFFELRDMAFRVAGLGSLGLPRYAVLVKGRGDPDKNVLFDLKGSAPSSAATLMPTKQPKWATQSERVTTLQKRLQAISAAYLTNVRISRRDYVLRELQPSEDRLNLAALAKNRKSGLSSLTAVFEQMGQIAASMHLRGAGRDKADGPDILIKFGAKADTDSWLNASQQLKELNNLDYVTFKAAHEADDARLAATLKF